MNIFVGNLSFKTTEQELQREFEAFGEVDSVKIIIDRETLKSRGFAFVEMPNQDQATAAIAALNGKELAGQILKVNEAKPREPRSGGDRGRPGRSFGSGGGGRPSGGFGGGGRDRDERGGGGYDRDGGGIYDSKGRGGRGPGNKGRGGRGPGSGGGRSGGGRRSH